MNTLPWVDIWKAILAFASAFVLLANAAEKIIKAVKAARAPNENQNTRLDALEKWREEVDKKLSVDNDRFKAIDESNCVTQHALLALLSHGIDGNNIKQLQTAKEKLQDYLINR